MPGDPKDCRKHAANCQRLAQEAQTPEAKEHFIRLATQWEQLAVELDSTLSLLHVVDEIGSSNDASGSLPPHEP